MERASRKYGFVNGCIPTNCYSSVYKSFLPDDAQENRTGQRVDAGIPRRTYYRPSAPVEEAMDGMEVDAGDYLQEPFIPINHSQQPLQRTHEALSREQKWDADMDEIVDDFIAGQVTLGEIADEAVIKRHASIADTLSRYGSSLQCCDSPMVQERSVPVLFIDEQFCLRINVPVHRCNSCDNRVAPAPRHLGCLPAHPTARNVINAGNLPHPPRWISVPLLRLCDTLCITSRGRLSSHAFVKTILHCHEENKCTEKLGFDHFRKQMDDVMQVSFLKLLAAAFISLKLFI